MSTVAEQPTLSPMLLQYQDYKRSYPDCFILFQVGDFYELFFEDAVEVSRILNLTLTSRDKNSASPIPMCGVPIAVVDSYLERLVDAGASAAIVSQVPGAAPAKGGVARYLERIITPGIRLLEHTGSAAEESVVAALYLAGDGDACIAFTSLDGGEVFVKEGVPLRALHADLRTIAPRELVLPRSVGAQRIDRRLGWVNELERASGELSLRFRADPSLSAAEERQRSVVSIPGYSQSSGSARKAIRLLLQYIDEIVIGAQLPIRCITPFEARAYLQIDATTRRNLELLKNARTGGREGTLFSVLDHTRSIGGSRLLRRWILQPLIAREEISFRQSVVDFFMQQDEPRGQMRELLRDLGDLERIATRIELRVALPRELASLRDALERLPAIRELLEGGAAHEKIRKALDGTPECCRLLCSSLAELPEPTLLRGGVIRDGYHHALDQLREIRRDGRAWMGAFEARERETTGINSLKVKNNNVLGYFIEVTSANVSRVPEHYQRRQSTANAERFTTLDLKRREEEVSTAEEKQCRLERELYETLREQLMQYAGEIHRIASALAELDVLVTFAEVGTREAWRLPQIDDSMNLEIERGSHPVLRAMLQSKFVPTSLTLGDGGPRAIVLTGPNMGGKSTYLRQAALIVILAQIGAPVPAEHARVGVVDRIFARIGASDNLSEGESTFMVEMREASHIVANATERSLVLIDEIGRGTATADGLALAQAVLEWVVLKLKCKTLFATHFHELTALEGTLAGVQNFSVASFEERGEVVFTHEIKRGAANKSYGLEVARLAGLPPHLLARARQLLERSSSREQVEEERQISIFQAADLFAQESESMPTWGESTQRRELEHAVLEQLMQVNILTTTPVDALNILNDLLSLVRLEAKETGDETSRS